jgi:hypothetical protein
VPSLEELARILGGAIRTSHDHDWLDTTVGELRAAVIRRVRMNSGTVVYDLAVFMPCVRQLDPFGWNREVWHLDGAHAAPRLRHGYMFGECRAGVLFATSSVAPSLEQIIATLWELADWARKPWTRVPTADRAQLNARERRRTWQHRLVRAVIVVIVAVLLRKLYPSEIDRATATPVHSPSGAP